MIKKSQKEWKSANIYLTHVCRHQHSIENPGKRQKSFQPTLWFSLAVKPQCWLKAPLSFHWALYATQMCTYVLTFFIMSPLQVLLLYKQKSNHDNILIQVQNGLNLIGVIVCMLTQKARDLWFHFGSGKNLCFEISSYIIMFTRIFHHHCFRDGIKNLHFELLTDLVNLLPVIICNL